jgi:uncharacterized protein (DUF3084 family)
LELDRRLAAGVAEGFHADLISGKDRLIENKDEQLREAETLVLARDRQVQQAKAALDQAEAELANQEQPFLAACVPAWPSERSRCEVTRSAPGQVRASGLTAKTTCYTGRTTCWPSRAIALCGRSDRVLPSIQWGRRHSLAAMMLFLDLRAHPNAA